MKRFNKYLMMWVLVLAFIMQASVPVFAQVTSQWVEGIRNLHVAVDGRIMFQTFGENWIYSNCSSTYAYISQDNPSQKSVLAMILMAKGLNMDIQCRIDKKDVDNHCEVYQCKL